MKKETDMYDKLMGNPITPAIHVLYRSDFRDESMWKCILESHGINSSEEDGIEYEEITIRATVECYQ